MLRSFVKRCTKCIRISKELVEEADAPIDCCFDPGDIPFTIYLESGNVLQRVYHDGCDFDNGPDATDVVCRFCGEDSNHSQYSVNLGDIVAVCRHE